MEDGSSTEQTLRNLRKSYADNLPKLLVELQQKAEEMRQSGWDMDAVKSFKQLTHRFAGSTASFGFRMVNARLKTLEAFLTEVLVEPTPKHTTLESQLETLMEETARAFQEDHQEELIEQIDAVNGHAIRHARSIQQIFLVEDDPYQAEELAAQIGYFGYSVDIFNDLNSLKEAMFHTNPRAIIMDVIFPEGLTAGPETIYQMKNEHKKVTPVIFISESNSIACRLQGVRAGGEAYFTKPVDIGDMIDSLDRLTVHESNEGSRVLLVDDKPEESQPILQNLSELGCDTLLVTDPLQVMQPLVDFDPNFILLDMTMKICSGIELAKVIRQMEQFMITPLFYLSSQEDLREQLMALGMDGEDFLPKNIGSEDLRIALASRAERFRLLRSMMLRDSLTGLYNHSTLKALLDSEIARASRQQCPLSFAMLDIDHFKAVNDAYGHPAGDRVLKSLARLLTQRLRKTDSVGRYGGEEFGIILPNTPVPAAAGLMDVLRDGFAHIINRAGNQEFTTRFSCGVAGYPEYKSPDALIEAADKMLYAAKSGGRNRVIYTDEGKEVDATVENSAVVE